MKIFWVRVFRMTFHAAGVANAYCALVNFCADDRGMLNIFLGLLNSACVLHIAKTSQEFDNAVSKRNVDQ